MRPHKVAKGLPGDETGLDRLKRFGRHFMMLSGNRSWQANDFAWIGHA
jgi:hypothetical protein